MDWDTDYDVKEYRPKRKRAIGADGRELLSRPELTHPSAPVSIQPLTGAASMQTSEILDFAEGN